MLIFPFFMRKSINKPGDKKYKQKYVNFHEEKNL